MFGITIIGCDNDLTNNNETPTTYSVTFNSNGGSDVSTITGISSGATIELPANPTRANYTFAGWFIDDTAFQNQLTASTVIISNITVFAKWDSLKTPFEGSWLGTNADGSSPKIWVFTGNEFLAVIAGKNNAKGTFTYTETVLTFTATHMWDELGELQTWDYTVDGNYTLNGNELLLDGDGNGKPFIKQP